MTVTVTDDGTQQSAAVTTGVVGPDLTEMASGPTAGRVGIADLTAAIPTSTASSRAGGGATWLRQRIRRRSRWRRAR